MTDSPLPPAGWYRDPGGEHRHRYWDGERWTPGVADRAGRVTEAPLSAEGSARAWAERQDRRRRFPVRAAGFAVVAFVLSTIAAGVLATVGSAVGDVGALVGGATGLYGGTFLACRRVSRRYGSGSLVDDYGLRYGEGDWWRGLLVSLLARIGAVVVAVVVYAMSEEFAGTNTAAFEEHRDSVGFLVAAALLAVVVAPFFEELFFRGLVQQSLESTLPVPAAIGIQAVLFGFAHLGGADGWGNVGVVAGTAGAGVVFGLVARRYHRLGPGMVGHGFFNLVPVVLLLLLD